MILISPLKRSPPLFAYTGMLASHVRSLRSDRWAVLIGKDANKWRESFALQEEDTIRLVSLHKRSILQVFVKRAYVF